MKKYTTRKKAFKHAMDRAAAEGHEMMVVFNSRFKDMVVRKDVGQKQTPEQVVVARCQKVKEKNHLGKETERWDLTELSHGLKLT